MDNNHIKTMLLRVYLILAVLEGIASLEAVLLSPTHPKNAWFMRYSPARISLIVCILFIVVYFAWLLLKFWTSPRALITFIEIRITNWLVFIITLIITTSLLMISFYWITMPENLLLPQAYIARLAPLIILGAAIGVQTLLLTILLYRGMYNRAKLQIFFFSILSWVQNIMDSTKLKTYLTTRWKILFIIILSTFVIVSNIIRTETLYNDGYIWLPLTIDFFSSIGNSDGIHRPLFAFLSWIIYTPVSMIYKAIFYPVGFDANLYAGYIWRFENVIFYLLSIFMGYKAVLKLTGSKDKALFFAVMISISAEMYAWLNITLINVQGISIIYISFFMVIDYIKSITETELEKRPIKLLIYSLIFGILMLGKAQYNIAGAIIVFTLFFAREYLRDMIYFSVIQFVPLILWILALYLFGLEYNNYEISRGGYTLVGALIDRFGQGNNFIMGVHYFFLKSIQDSSGTINEGLGVILFITIWLFIGSQIGNRLGKFMLVYYLFTAIFLLFVNFLMARHACDFAPIGYLGLAWFFNWLQNKMPPTFFWPLFMIIIFIWALVNQSSLFRIPIIGG